MAVPSEVSAQVNQSWADHGNLAVYYQMIEYGCTLRQVRDAFVWFIYESSRQSIVATARTLKISRQTVRACLARYDKVPPVCRSLVTELRGLTLQELIRVYASVAEVRLSGTKDDKAKALGIHRATLHRRTSTKERS